MRAASDPACGLIAGLPVESGVVGGEETCGRRCGEVGRPAPSWGWETCAEQGSVACAELGSGDLRRAGVGYLRRAPYADFAHSSQRELMLGGR